MRSERITHPIQEAEGPEDHFPPERRKAEGERDRDKTNPVRTSCGALACPSLLGLQRFGLASALRRMEGGTKKNLFQKSSFHQQEREKNSLRGVNPKWKFVRT